MAVRTDHDRLRVAVFRHAEDRLGNVGVHVFRDRQALGLETRIPSNPGALPCFQTTTTSAGRAASNTPASRTA